MNPGTKGNKPKYVSKAQRAKLDAEQEVAPVDATLEQAVEPSENA